jgi:large subunit ribosomal protein L1
MVGRGKRYMDSLKLVDRAEAYLPEEAIDLAKKVAFARFDETLEFHLRTGLDPRRSDQQVRGVALLPHGRGKNTRIVCLTQGEGVKIAEDAGADYVGGDDLIQKIEGGWLEFDATLATPDIMGKVARLGKILGRRGLMPNPKIGTIVSSPDLPRVIGDLRKGRVEFRLDRTGIIHLPLGKISFERDKLLENLRAALDSVVKARPSGAKGQYIKSSFISSSMGPGIRIDLRPLLGTL